MINNNFRGPGHWLKVLLTAFLRGRRGGQETPGVAFEKARKQVEAKRCERIRREDYQFEISNLGGLKK